MGLVGDSGCVTAPSDEKKRWEFGALLWTRVFFLSGRLFFSACIRPESAARPPRGLDNSCGAKIAEQRGVDATTAPLWKPSKQTREECLIPDALCLGFPGRVECA